MTETELAAEYSYRYEKFLRPLADHLSMKIADDVKGTPRIDRVSARAKSPDRFLAKAAKVVDGKKKYDRPLEQIQDQIGARILTFYLDDVEAVAKIVDQYYRYIEAKNMIPESESEFGYVGKHYIVMMPDDLPFEGLDENRTPKFFELQIKTLFQHAWSEAGHDLAYKPTQPLTSLQKRQLAFTAAQAWGADQIFSTLSKELSTPAAVSPPVA